jgi:hypothetical protein
MVVVPASGNLNGFVSDLLKIQNVKLKELQGIVIRFVILVQTVN